MAKDAVGTPVRLILTGGEKADSPQAVPLLTGVKAAHVIADKGYDANGVLGFISAQGATAVIPPKSNRKVQREYDRELYKQRNVIERSFNRLKSWRRIATRYDRRSVYFLAFLHLAAAVTWNT
jgi:transposase